MLNIMKNTLKILVKRKGFVLATFILPIFAVLFFSVVYSSNSSLKVAFINNDKGILGDVIKDTVKEIDSIDITEVSNKENKIENLIFNKYSIIITIDKDYTEKTINGDISKIKVKSIGENEIKTILEGVIENKSSTLNTLCKNIDGNKVGIDKIIKTYNESKPKVIINKKTEDNGSINNSLGFIIYLISISSALSVVFLLEDEKLRTKDRILMSKISEKGYLASMGILFFLLTSIPAIEYYFTCKIFNYEFGFKNTYLLLIMMLFMVLLFVVFSIFISSIVKKKNVFNLINTCATLPVFMLGGCFWSFDIMSDKLQKIGNALPTRWFLSAVEKLQQGKGVSAILPNMAGILLLTVFFFLLSIYFSKKKIVLVNELK